MSYSVLSRRVNLKDCGWYRTTFSLRVSFLKCGWHIFWNSTPKTLENIQKKRFYCNSNTRLKAPLQILFWMCLKRIFWNFDNSKKVFANVSLFLLCYRLADQNLLLQRKQTPTKVFPVRVLPESSQWWRHFIEVTGLLSRFYKFLKHITPYIF